MKLLFRNMSLRDKITLAFMAMVLLILLVLGSVFYINTAEAIKLSKQNEMATIAHETADKVERFIFERSADIKVLSDSKVLTLAGTSEKAKLDHLNNIIEAYKTYDGILLTGPDGAVRLSSGEIPDLADILNEINGGAPFISEVDSADGDKVMIFSRPLIGEDGLQAGAVATVMSLDSIKAIVKNVRIGTTGYATLADGVDLETTEGMIFYGVPVQNFETTGEQWHIGVYQEKSEAYDVIDDFIKYLMLVFLATVILFLFLSIVLSRIITEPIRELMDKMGQMTRAPASSGKKTPSRDEIGNLSSSFNSLLEQLNFMMQMVLEKTGEAADMGEINENIGQIFESIPNGILTIDALGQISSVNKTAAEILKLDGQNPNQSILAPSGTEHEDFFRILASSLKSGRKYSGEICYIPVGSGEQVPIVFNTLRQTDQNGELIGMTVVMNLLEDKKRREEAIFRAKRLSELGQMAAGVAHEIRNPLASIKGYAQCARLEFDESRQIYQDLTVILNEVERLDWIVERFMKFAQPDKPQKAKVEVAELIDGTIRLMKNDFVQAGVGIRVSGPSKGWILADSDQIKQVLINILLNGIQVSSPGDEILIASKVNEEDHAFEICITDQGPGIREELIERVFTPFYTTKEKGSGLGLSISTRIIENHGGTLEIANEPGRGASALIKLPLKGEPDNDD